jgi:hypothetical protein
MKHIARKDGSGVMVLKVRRLGSGCRTHPIRHTPTGQDPRARFPAKPGALLFLTTSGVPATGWQAYPIRHVCIKTLNERAWNAQAESAATAARRPYPPTSATGVGAPALLFLSGAGGLSGPLPAEAHSR